MAIPSVLRQVHASFDEGSKVVLVDKLSFASLKLLYQFFELPKLPKKLVTSVNLLSG